MSVVPFEAVSPAELADELGISSKTVMRAIKAGHLRASQLADRGCWRIRPEAVEEWFEARSNRVRAEREQESLPPLPPALRPRSAPNRIRGRRTTGRLSVPPKRKDAG